MTRRIRRIALGASFAIAACASGALMLALDEAPRVVAPARFDVADVERALVLLRQHDPRRQRPGIVRAIALRQGDVQMLLQHAAARVDRLAAQVEFDTDVARVRLSLPAPEAIGPRWLNVAIDFVPGTPWPEVARWRVGALPLPAFVAWPLLRWAAERRLAIHDTQPLFEVVRRIDFRREQMLVFYAWRDDTTARLRSALVTGEDQARLQAYHDRLAAWSRQTGNTQARSAADLIATMFALARDRSRTEAEAAAENRAALLTLALYATGIPPTGLIPAARSWPPVRAVRVTLAGRDDLPQHYLLSAVLAAEAGRPLAEAIGAVKEQADSRGGSGFSFTDLLADRAGARLGQRATRHALSTQRHLASIDTEAQLLPPLDGLPDALSAEDLGRRFGSADDPNYRRLLDDIDSRLNRLEALR